MECILCGRGEPRRKGGQCLGDREWEQGVIPKGSGSGGKRKYQTKKKSAKKWEPAKKDVNWD